MWSEELKNISDKEQELQRLLKVKSEKLANDYLMKNRHTQLSYLPKEEQAQMIAIPKGLILDKLLHYLRSL